jgi:multidrug resistance efflux pump
MRRGRWWALFGLLAWGAGVVGWEGRGAPQAGASPPGTSAALVADGRTEPSPGRVATLAPTVLQPVKEVLVSEGASVKKDQALIRFDDDEARAAVRGKKAKVDELEASLARARDQPRDRKLAELKANLEKAKVTTKGAREKLRKLEHLAEKGAAPEASLRAARTAYAEAQKDEKAAQAQLDALKREPVLLKIEEFRAQLAGARADLEAAKAQLEGHTLRAPLAGVVTRLTANVGMIARPGTAVWGEVMDLREIDVRCHLTPAQARRVRVGQGARVAEQGSGESALRGTVVMVGVAADRATGKVPVLVRLKNPEGRLRCFVPVRVTFEEGGTKATRR